jgi:hypothetical protein
VTACTTRSEAAAMHVICCMAVDAILPGALVARARVADSAIDPFMLSFERKGGLAVIEARAAPAFLVVAFATIPGELPTMWGCFRMAGDAALFGLAVLSIGQVTLPACDPPMGSKEGMIGVRMVEGLRSEPYDVGSSSPMLAVTLAAGFVRVL